MVTNQAIGRGRGTWFLVALSGILVIGALVASGAFAAAVKTSSSRWYVNGSGLKTGETRQVNCAVGETGGAKRLVFSSSFSGTPVRWEATGIECLNSEKTAPAAIRQDAPTTAKWSGRLRLTGLKFIEPAPCAFTKAGSLTEITTELVTKELTADIYREGETKENERLLERFSSPAFGEEWAEFGISKCTLSQPHVSLKGSLFGQLPGKMGSPELQNQTLTFNSGIQKAAGGNLFSPWLGPVNLEGQVNQTIGSGKTAASWGLRES